MSENAKSYSIADGVCNIGGNATGAGEAGFVKVVPTADRVTPSVGIDGTIVLNNNPAGDVLHTVTITLLGSSVFNAILTALAKANAFAPLVIVAPHFTFTGRAKIMRIPDVELGAKMGDHVWTLAAVGVMTVTGMP